MFYYRIIAILLIMIDCGRREQSIFENKFATFHNPKQLMIFSFDGFGYSYLNPSLTPNLFRLANEQGVTGHMLPTFSTKTLPNHHSISTGLFQETHGIVHNQMFDPLFDESFDDEDQRSQKWWDNHLSTPIYIANQLRNPSKRSSCCAPWIGCHASYKNYRTKYFRRFNKSSNPYELLEWSLEKMMAPNLPANLAMIYLPQPDMTAHLHGPFGSMTIEEVKKIDQFVGYLLDRLEQLKIFPNVILMADHGLSAIHPERSIVLETFLNSSWYYAYGSNPIYTIRIVPGYEKIVYESLHKHFDRLPFKVYRKNSIPERFQYRDHRRIHHLMVLAEEGWSIFNTKQDLLKNKNHRGQHGYDNLAKSMRPLFLAFGPSFRKGYLHPKQFINVDLYPLMLILLDINPRQHYHQGDVTNVIEMLRT
ncbi:Bis(5'-adenosyl)-triphosphatase ENPP4 [Sarcoptes scabiei]|uniref:Bis(5'-adenosyl)-triphosphatase ENPP4 n=2 Tax=Sarcoptes scabiei TaxID=52283 RepID=A0A834R433_SARSC|nr:Bis(5'-adenosyl)-triphosphatase ENPP4 [Sarcoptes scabiei]UXI23148.1 hypothetical protein NH340_JMT09091 [Sarcoptes scabiei]